MSERKQGWMDVLEDEDWAFVKRFLLASGSLKEVAREYGISYPTVRLRLDRLITKIKVADAYEHRSPMEKLLRSLFGEGKMDGATFKQLLKTYLEEKEGGNDQGNPSA